MLSGETGAKDPKGDLDPVAIEVRKWNGWSACTRTLFRIHGGVSRRECNLDRVGDLRWSRTHRSPPDHPIHGVPEHEGRTEDITHRNLVGTIKGSVTIDWTVRENVQADLRVIVKRILRKYGYPPDKQERATQTVLEQAKVLSEGWASA